MSKKNTVITGKTSGGFEFTSDVRVLDDMRFVRLLNEVDENPVLFPEICEKILGKEGEEALYRFIEDEDGYASSEAVVPVISEIIKIISEKSETVKNLLSSAK